MSDQSPPPKPKPGSLRDRIAAFENKGPPTPPGPPPPRPKPGNLQWKPKHPSPPTTPGSVQPVEHKPPSTGGMSASDAMESIGRAGSLKERMAALQGKGGFGGTPPPVAPKPNVERPKWKPPPATHVTSDDESKQGTSAPDAGGREASRSPPPRAAVSPTPGSQGISHGDEDVVAQEGDAGDQDPEEQERQRRATIAARMARLGGARFGMGPPIFAPKPVTRKAESAVLPHEAKDDAPVDQESSEALITSPPHDLPVSASPAFEAPAETEHSDDTDPSQSVPPRVPTSMPVPAGPRRAAPPRKKASKSAPTTTLPEPPEDAQTVVVTDTDHAVHDVPLTTADSQMEFDEVLQTVEATSDEHSTVPVDAEQLPTSPSVPAFHEQTDESEQQEAEEEPLVIAPAHVEGESICMAADDQEVPLPSEQPLGDVDAEEEAHRQRVAAKLAQMGAFNPLSGLPPVPRRSSSLNEPLDVEDEVNVDTEEWETIAPPPTVPSRLSVGQSVKHDAAGTHLEGQDDAKLDADTQVSADRDGEHVVAWQGDCNDGNTSPCPEFSEEQPIEHDLFFLSATASTQQAGAFESSPPRAEARDPQECSLQGEATLRSRTPSEENDASKDELQVDDMPPPRITRPIPPPPVNLRSKPMPSSSPEPLSPPPRTSLQALRVDEEERPPVSPDMPPRPIPPPGRSGSLMEDASSSAPRRSIPPPPRRTSVQMTEPMTGVPSPPAPTSPRPANRRSQTPPPIITTLVVPERATSEEYGKEASSTEGDTSEDVTPQPGEQEDEESARRRAIAERMARLGGIRFGGPLMNPLSRPPLPAAPPPTSVPPDDEGETEEEGPREEEEEDKMARKQRITAKLTGMGGMGFGMLPSGAGLPPATARRLVSKQEDSENEDAVAPVPVPAPAQRPPPTRKPPPPVEVTAERESERRTSDDGVKVEAEESEMKEVHYSDAGIPVPSEEEAPALPPPPRSSHTPRSAEALPTPPPRMTSRSPPPGRPPVPIISPSLLGRRPSTSARSVSVTSSRASMDDSSPSETPTATGRASTPSEYVMVDAEEPDSDTSPTPAPRRRSARGAPSIPLPPVPPPSAIDPPESLTSSAQWELPSIPQGNEFGDIEIASSGWSEDSTAVHIHVPMVSTSPAGSRPESRRTSGKPLASSGSGFGSGTIGSEFGSVGSGQRSIDQRQPLTTDALMAIWGKVGVQVVDAATTLFEKSKRTLVGDGSHAGFVRAVLAQVPGVIVPDVGGEEWGYVVYAQTSGEVQRRVSDIMPGDVVAFWDAKFKGHKGLHAYTQTAGAGAECGGAGGQGPEALVGIVSEFDGKKSKVRVWQANQRVGQQTVEVVSYRLDDMKAGQVKVYRVLEAC